MCNEKANEEVKMTFAQRLLINEKVGKAIYPGTKQSCDSIKIAEKEKMLKSSDIFANCVR